MTRQETAKLLTIISAANDRFTINEEKVAVWHAILEDIPFAVAQKATMVVLATNIHPPSVAEIREAALSYMRPHLPTAGEAWAEINRAVSRYGVYRSKEALASMSPLTRRVAECIGWETICLGEGIEGVLRSHFVKMYDEQREYEHRWADLPPALNSRPETKMLADHFKGVDDE